MRISFTKTSYFVLILANVVVHYVIISKLNLKKKQI